MRLCGPTQEAATLESCADRSISVAQQRRKKYMHAPGLLGIRVRRRREGFGHVYVDHVACMG